MPSKTTLSASDDGDDKPLNKLYKALERLISNIPTTDENASKDAHARAHSIVNAAAAKAAFVSGGLALPPGPLGFATIIPDLIAIWKIQAQMVADIAGAFGKTACLTREQMLYCLFKQNRSRVGHSRWRAPSCP